MNGTIHFWGRHFKFKSNPDRPGGTLMGTHGGAEVEPKEAADLDEAAADNADRSDNAAEALALSSCITPLGPPPSPLLPPDPPKARTPPALPSTEGSCLRTDSLGKFWLQFWLEKCLEFPF